MVNIISVCYGEVMICLTCGRRRWHFHTGALSSAPDIGNDRQYSGSERSEKRKKEEKALSDSEGGELFHPTFLSPSNCCPPTPINPDITGRGLESCSSPANQETQWSGSRRSSRKPQDSLELLRYSNLLEDRDHSRLVRWRNMIANFRRGWNRFPALSEGIRRCSPFSSPAAFAQDNAYNCPGSNQKTKN